MASRVAVFSLWSPFPLGTVFRMNSAYFLTFSLPNHWTLVKFSGILIPTVLYSVRNSLPPLSQSYCTIYRTQTCYYNLVVRSLPRHNPRREIIRRIQELHRKWGLIMRIDQYQSHVNDPESRALFALPATTIKKIAGLAGSMLCDSKMYIRHSWTRSSPP